MMVLSAKEKNELKKIFDSNLEKDVEILVFLDFQNNPEPSKIGKELFDEISEISDGKIKVRFYDSNSDGKELIEKYGLALDKYGKRFGPIIIFKEKPNIVFYGLPEGQEFMPFLEDIFAISKNKIEINLKAAKKIAKIDKNIEILIFVTPSCPYCPIMTSAAHKFAFLNPKVKGVMVMATEFPEFSDAYNVYAVPKNVIRINGKDVLMWEGALPEHLFAERLYEILENV